MNMGFYDAFTNEQFFCDFRIALSMIKLHEGDPIPEDFICPLCKHPASDFSKIE